MFLKILLVVSNQHSPGIEHFWRVLEYYLRYKLMIWFCSANVCLMFKQYDKNCFASHVMVTITF